jgi:hypothetical protein
MKMDRNINADGTGKYAVINMRKLEQYASGETFERWTPDIENAIKTLDAAGVIEWGAVGTEDEFFLIKLKDRHSLPALRAYADSVLNSDPEFSTEVADMVMRSGRFSQWCKEPD